MEGIEEEGAKDPVAPTNGASSTEKLWPLFSYVA